MKALEKIRHRHEKEFRRKQLHRALMTMIDGLALISFSRTSRRRRLAFAAAEAVFADRAHRRLHRQP